MPPRPTMIIGPKVASTRVPMMISTPFFAIGPTSTPWIAASGRCLRALSSSVSIGDKRLALGGDVDADAADLALVRNIGRLDLHHQRKAHARDRGIERALARVTSTSSGSAMPASRSSALLSASEKRLRFQMRGDIARRQRVALRRRRQLEFGASTHLPHARRRHGSVPTAPRRRMPQARAARTRDGSV